MDVIGGENMIERGPEDEGPHPQINDEWWQESVTLIWWDQQHGIGGFHRIGHEPNYQKGPYVYLTNSVFFPHKVYRRSEFIPMQPGDEIENGFGGGDGHCTFQFINNQAIWTLNDSDVSLELAATDYHCAVDVWPKSGELGKDVAPEHMEVASGVKGTVSLQGKTYDIDGIAFRDHGWGIRHWEKIMVYRWVVGVFDENLTVFAMNFLSPDGTLSKFGVVYRDGQFICCSDVDIATYIEADGFTHRGGRVTLTLATDEIMEIECAAMQKGTVNSHHGSVWLDTFCKMTYGDKVGFCDFEIANRPFQGTAPPVLLMKAIAENGLFDSTL